MIYKNTIGKIILDFEKVESTNDTAALLIREHALPEGTIIRTSEQVSGKGMDGGFWESEKGKNITVSVIVHPCFLHPEKQFMLNKISSLAVADLVSDFLPKRQVRIKWPNDVYVDNKKIAGILINNTLEGNKLTCSILGIGININQDTFVNDIPNPVSLRNISSKSYNLDFCLYRLCDKLNFWYYLLYKDEFDYIDEEYLLRLYKFEEQALYKLKGKTTNARIVGVDEYGKLCLEMQDAGIYKFDLKEVELVHT